MLKIEFVFILLLSFLANEQTCQGPADISKTLVMRLRPEALVQMLRILFHKYAAVIPERCMENAVVRELKHPNEVMYNIGVGISSVC